jgi:hypothetical protein
MKPEIYAIVAAVNELTRQMAVDEERIEKLEAALRFYACGCKSVEGCNFLGSTCGKFARKALEGKDD